MGVAWASHGRRMGVAWASHGSRRPWTVYGACRVPFFLGRRGQGIQGWQIARAFPVLEGVHMAGRRSVSWIGTGVVDCRTLSRS